MNGSIPSGSGGGLSGQPGGAEYVEGLRQWRRVLMLAAALALAMPAVLLSVWSFLRTNPAASKRVRAVLNHEHLGGVIALLPVHALWALPALRFRRASGLLVQVPECTGERAAVAGACDWMKAGAMAAAAAPLLVQVALPGWKGVAVPWVLAVTTAFATAAWCIATAALGRSTVRVGESVGLDEAARQLTSAARCHLTAGFALPAAAATLFLSGRPELHSDSRGLLIAGVVLLLIGLPALAKGLFHLMIGLGDFVDGSPSAGSLRPPAYRVGSGSEQPVEGKP